MTEKKKSSVLDGGVGGYNQALWRWWRWIHHILAMITNI